MSYNKNSAIAAIGQKGKSYGLIIQKKTAPPAKNALAKPSIFNRPMDDPDEDLSSKEAVNRRMKEDAIKRSQSKNLENTYAKALAEDPTVFSYDEVFDEVASTKARSAAKSAENHPLSGGDPSKPKSRYIESLVAKAKVKEIENDRVFERKLIKERQVDEHLYGDKEKFVTSKYKALLQERKMWENQERLEEMVEEKQSAANTGGGMEGFYANLLTKNIAMGGDVDKHATSAWTAGSKVSEKRLEGTKGKELSAREMIQETVTGQVVSDKDPKEDISNDSANEHEMSSSASKPSIVQKDASAMVAPAPEPESDFIKKAKAQKEKMSEEAKKNREVEEKQNEEERKRKREEAIAAAKERLAQRKLQKKE
jgi:coiled-coil domain-containing protein 55